MCAITEKLSEEVFKKGEARGMEKGFFKSIVRMIKKLNMTPDAAMDVLDVPERERVVYLEMLKQQ